MKAVYSKILRSRTAVIAGLMAMLLIMAGGCSKSTPGCDDGKTVKAVINTVSQNFRKNLSGIAGMGGPGMELSEDEWKTIRSGMLIDLENIREQSFDQAAGKRTCSANLMVVQGGKKDLIPITYVPEVNKETGELNIMLSGLDEFRKTKEQPAPLPE
jgi:hypothetical protein